MRTSVATDDRALVAQTRPWMREWERREPTARGKIGLFGMFGCGNTGNDGSLEAMLIFLRNTVPGAKLACISTAADQIAPKFGLRPISIGGGPPESIGLRKLDALLLGVPHKLTSLVGALWHTRNLDVMIIPGTGILDDFGDGPTGVSAALFGWCLAARLCRTKIAFVSIGAGPIHHPLSRWLMKKAAAMAHYRSYRDMVSKRYMESIGFDTRSDSVYPDIAFKLPAPPSTRGATADGRVTVGVGVMTYFGWRNDSAAGADIYAAYLEKITRFVLWLLDCGHPVRILMGDASDQRAITDLMANVATVRPDLPQDRLSAAAVTSLHDLMAQIVETDVVVATRFHNVVCALKLGKPLVSIGYAEKNDVLMTEMGLGHFCQHIEHLDLDLLIEQFRQLVAKRESCSQKIRNTSLVYQERLDHQYSLLASRFLHRSPGSRTHA